MIPRNAEEARLFNAFLFAVTRYAKTLFNQRGEFDPDRITKAVAAGAYAAWPEFLGNAEVWWRAGVRTEHACREYLNLSGQKFALLTINQTYGATPK